MIAHISEPPPDVSEHRPLAEAFDEVVRRALAKRPDDRYSSAGELARATADAAAKAPDADGPELRAKGLRQAPPRAPAAAGDAPTAA
jgi:serine/threonine-protein kinase